MSAGLNDTDVLPKRIAAELIDVVIRTVPAMAVGIVGARFFVL